MGQVWIVQSSFDIADAAVEKHLREACAEFAGFKREPKTPASTIYYLHSRWKGKVFLRKVSENKNELSAIPPEKPYRVDMTAEQFEWEVSNAQIPSLTDEQKRERLREVISDETKTTNRG